MKAAAALFLRIPDPGAFSAWVGFVFSGSEPLPRDTSCGGGVSVSQVGQPRQSFSVGHGVNLL